MIISNKLQLANIKNSHWLWYNFVFKNFKLGLESEEMEKLWIDFFFFQIVKISWPARSLLAEWIIKFLQFCHSELVTKTPVWEAAQLQMCMCSQSCPTSLQPRELWPSRLLCPWNFPGKNTGVGCLFLLQAIFPTQGSNPRLLWLLNSEMGSLPLSQPGSPSVNQHLQFWAHLVVPQPGFCNSHLLFGSQHPFPFSLGTVTQMFWGKAPFLIHSAQLCLHLHLHEWIRFSLSPSTCLSPWPQSQWDLRRYLLGFLKERGFSFWEQPLEMFSVLLCKICRRKVRGLELYPQFFYWGGGSLGFLGPAYGSWGWG